MSSQIGIRAVGRYLPEGRTDSYARKAEFNFEDSFIKDKIGFETIARKAESQETSDLAVAAIQALADESAMDLGKIDVLALVTQNPDGFGLPHTAAVVHGKLRLPNSCFCFDISLGCSGFVAGLGILKGYMSVIGAKNGLLVTADPYSKVVDQGDRNTALIFGDGATATWLSDEPLYSIGAMDQGTDGSQAGALVVKPNRELFMNGRAVFDFCALNVPKSLKRTLEINAATADEVDAVLLHQGSKYIVDTIAQRSGMKKAVFAAGRYGNTVSSSIPILLVDSIAAAENTILVSGFGVGLGWATTILKRL